MLLLRADADGRIGGGHVLRGLALAQAWQDAGGRAVFACGAISDALAVRIRDEGAHVVRIDAAAGTPADAASAAFIAHEHRATWIVVDGYHFDAGYRAALRARGLRVLWVADAPLPAGPCAADVVLHPLPRRADAQGAAADRPTARADDDGEPLLLAGAEYVPLRREFRGLGDRDRAGNDEAALGCDARACRGDAGAHGPGPTGAPQRTNPSRRVLVTLGGGDAGEHCLRVVRALELTPIGGLEAQVVIGSECGERAAKAIERAAARLRCAVRVERAPCEMTPLMDGCEVAVAAAGGTAWELACRGTPAILLVRAENQGAVAEALDRAGAAHNLGPADDVRERDVAGALTSLLNDPRRRSAMRRAGRALVDGRGAARVVEALRSSRAELPARV